MALLRGTITRVASDASGFIRGGWPLMGVACIRGRVASDGNGFIRGGGWPLMGVAL